MGQLSDGLKIDNYTLVKLLGKGGFGEVWEVKDDVNHRHAMKIFNDSGYSSTNLSPFEDEFDLISNLNHPNLLIPTQLERFNTGYYIVMPLCKNSLMDELKSRIVLLSETNGTNSEIYSEKELTTILRDVADGLAYLNEQGIVHKDIKPDNILVQEQGRKVVYKISDFGISDKFAVSALKVTKLLDSKAEGIAKAYAPPEYFDKKVDSKSDVFSLAMSVYELATGDTLQGQNGLAYGESMNNTKELPEIPDWLSYSRRFRMLLLACLNFNSKQRPSAKDIAVWADEFLNKGFWPNEMVDHLSKLNANVTSSITPHGTKNLKNKLVFAIGILFFLFLALDYFVSIRNRSIADKYFNKGDILNAMKYFTKSDQFIMSNQETKTQIEKLSLIWKNYSEISKFYGIFSIAKNNKSQKYTLIDKAGLDHLQRHFDLIVPLENNSFLLKHNSAYCDSCFVFKNEKMELFQITSNLTHEKAFVNSTGCVLIYKDDSKIGIKNCKDEIFTLTK